MTRTRPRWFYGWWIVLICALGLFLGPIPIIVFSFSVFLKPLVQEFHAGRGAISLAISLYSVTLACALPFTGRLMDRIGARKVILPSTFLVGLVLLSVWLCSGSIWQLSVFYMALAIASCGVTPVSYCDVISRWFDRRRGLALGCMMAGLGAGAIIVPSVAQYLIARFGWRFAFGIAGAAILLIPLPVVAIFLKNSPESLGLWPDGSANAPATSHLTGATYGLGWAEAWRTPAFWRLLCACVFVSASVQGCFAHIAAILADRGAPARIAALATSIYGGGLLMGRTGSGYLLDRFFAPRVAALIFGCTGIGIGLLLPTGSQQLAFTAAFFIGLGLGAEVDIMAYLTSRYFGLRSFGVIYGFIFAGFGLSAGLGQYLMGAAFDATGSYVTALALFCGATLFGAILMLGLGPYRYQTKLGDEIHPRAVSATN